MKIASFEALALQVPEDDPLANMPEEAGRTRPAVTLRLRTDDGIEGIGVTLYGGKMSRSLHAAVEELSALTVGEDPMRIEHIVAKLRRAAGDSGPAGIFTLALSAIDTALWDIKGKALDQPLWKLLGGHRDRVADLRVGLAAARPHRQAGPAGGAHAAAEGLPRDEDPDGAARHADAGRGGAPRAGGARRDRARRQADVRHQPALAARAGDRHRLAGRGSGRRPVLAGGRDGGRRLSRASRGSPRR